MEYYYKAYTKIIDDVNFYFVKKYISYPEFKDTPPILESFGMHVSFKKACIIAQVSDPTVIETLYNEVSLELNTSLTENYSINIDSQKLSLSQRINLIRKNFTERITHWHLMPH